MKHFSYIYDRFNSYDSILFGLTINPEALIFFDTITSMTVKNINLEGNSAPLGMFL